MVVLEPPLYQWIKKSAQAEGVSLSMLLRDFVRDAYERCEDRYWSRAGEGRLKTLKKTAALSHAEFWKKAGL